MERIAEEKTSSGWGALRKYWRDLNRQHREAVARELVIRKAHDKRRAKCRCAAYPWPHRPRGGFCRHPDPPLERWQRKPGGRPYRKRYAGIRQQIARNNGLHPIKDRAAIDALMPRTMALAKQLHRQRPQYKYRHIEITHDGITGHRQTAGPRM